MPTTGADYRWMNLMARVPRKGIPTIAKRLAQGVGGLLLGRRYAAGGQALGRGPVRRRAARGHSHLDATPH